MKNRRKEKHGSPMQEKMLMENDKRGVIPIYDSMFKKILTLSARAVIGLINGLFGTDYPPDSTITYNWTENHDDNLKRTIADTILTVNGRHSYHMEAQMYEDEEIEFRVFDYGYRYALREGAGEDILRFPEPRVIQLYRHNGMPDTKTLILDFGIQGSFEYKIPVFKLLEHSIEELSRRRMIILIPFMLLKLRDSLKKERTLENMEALRKLVLDDIILSLTVSRLKNRCIPCIFWVTAIFTVVAKYSNLFFPFAFFLNGSHIAFGYELIIRSETTDFMEIIRDKLPSV